MIESDENTALYQSKISNRTFIEVIMNIKDQINHEIVRILELTKTSKIEDSEDFNIRGELYRLALDLAPKARDQDIEDRKSVV